MTAPASGRTPADQIDWSVIQYHALWLAIAYVLALPIAWNRERIARSAGLRTFP